MSLKQYDRCHACVQGAVHPSIAAPHLVAAARAAHPPHPLRSQCPGARPPAAAMVETRSASKSASQRRREENERKEQVWHRGVAISMWQNSGDEASNWTAFINSKFPFKSLPFGLNRYSGNWNVNERCPDTWDRCAAGRGRRGRGAGGGMAGAPVGAVGCGRQWAASAAGAAAAAGAMRGWLLSLTVGLAEAGEPAQEQPASKWRLAL